MFQGETAAGMLHDPVAHPAPPKVVHSMMATRSGPTKEMPVRHLNVTHHHTNSAHPAETHRIPIHQGTGLDEFHDHIEQHMGEPNEGEAECEDGNCNV